MCKVCAVGRACYYVDRMVLPVSLTLDLWSDGVDHSWPLGVIGVAVGVIDEEYGQCWY